MKSMVRKKTTSKDKEQDFVETHPLMVESLSNWIKENIPDYEHMSVEDPCCGNGIIWKGLQKLFYNITYYDKYIGRKRGNFLLRKGKYDIITMNCPYSNKYKFVEKARKDARYVFALFPHILSNYVCVHEDWEDIPEYVGRIKMSPKINLNTGKRGGNTMYVWYIWDSKNKTKTGKTWFDDLSKRGEI